MVQSHIYSRRKEKDMKRILCIVLCVLTVFSVCETAVYAKSATRWGAPKKAPSSDAYMLISLNDNNHTVLAAKNADKKKYPASLTKVVTVMVTLNHVKNIKKKIKVKQSALDTLVGTGAQSAGLRAGDTPTIEQLMYLAMVFSACDVCRVMGEAVAGSVPKFVKMMNAWVKQIGCKNTRFANPDGLHDANQYTTAADMRLIALEAVKNKTFLKISQTVSYEYRGTVFEHTNKSLHKKYKSYYYPYAKGIKTGYTKQAGRCLITIGEKGGYRYLAVILDAPLFAKKRELYNTMYFDAKILFEWAFRRFRMQEVSVDTIKAGSVNLEDAKGKDSLALVCKNKVQVLLPIGADSSNLKLQPIEKPEVVYAPIRKGEYICKAHLTYDGVRVAQADVITGETAELSKFSRTLRYIKEWFQGKR